MNTRERLSTPGARWVAAGALTAALAGVAAYGAVHSQSQLFGRTLVAPPHADQILLTFDDGPNPAATPRLLDVLARNGVQATFFLIGDFVRLEPALVRRIAAGGHAIGNHTMQHRYLALLPAAKVRQQLVDCNHALADVLGTSPSLFRPPHGARRPAVLSIAAELGLRTVQFNLIVGDWKPIAVGELASRVASRIASKRLHGRGTNLVLHDGGQAGLGADRQATVDAVARLLPVLTRSSRFVLPGDC